jgi:alkylhydroperoxidase family enzyme
MAGMPTPVLGELRNQHNLSDQKLDALRAFVLSVLANRGWVPDKDIKPFFDAGYSRRHLLDVLTILALKTLSNYTNHMANTPLDEQFSSQKWVAPDSVVA